MQNGVGAASSSSILHSAFIILHYLCPAPALRYDRGMRFAPALLLLPFLLPAGGCAETRTFQVAVRNETNRPLTLGLAKEGGKYEPQWQTPEQAAIHTDSKDERGWDSVVCPPGEVRSAGPVKGDFGGKALATVRVYSGD